MFHLEDGHVTVAKTGIIGQTCCNGLDFAKTIRAENTSRLRTSKGSLFSKLYGLDFAKTIPAENPSGRRTSTGSLFNKL